MGFSPADAFKWGQGVWGRSGLCELLEEVFNLKVTIMFTKGDIMGKSENIECYYSRRGEQRMNVSESIICQP